MKSLLFLVLAMAGIHSANATDVGVSIRIGQPGFYGSLDIGDYFPAPALIYPEPVVIVKRGVIDAPPMYLRVPPGHARRWGSYCGRYDACGRRVYFVRDDWYERVYVPAYRDRYYRDDRWHDDRDDRGRGRDYDEGRHGKGHGKGHGHDKHRH